MIVNEVEKLREKALEIVKEINALQDSCSHPDENLTYRYGANTGNWCESDDSYWKDFKCSYCGKRWMVYSYEPEYRSLKGIEIK